MNRNKVKTTLKSHFIQSKWNPEKEIFANVDILGSNLDILSKLFGKVLLFVQFFNGKLCSGQGIP